MIGYVNIIIPAINLDDEVNLILEDYKAVNAPFTNNPPLCSACFALSICDDGSGLVLENQSKSLCFLIF